MRLEKIYLFLMILGIPVAFFDLASGLGWIVGQLVMIALVIARSAFYDKVLDSTSFSMKLYVSYVLFTMLLISEYDGKIEPLKSVLLSHHYVALK